MVLHMYETEGDYLIMYKKSILLLLCFLMLIKTFFFMRLFRDMAHLVMMML